MRGNERSFGLSVGGICALIALVQLWHRRLALTWIVAVLASLLIVPALMRPSWLRIPNALWWRLAHGLGWINARILLSAVFFLIMTPVGLVLRLAGWDPLRRVRPATESLWSSYPQRCQDPKHYERMY